MFESSRLFKMLAKDTLGGGDDVCGGVCIIGLLRFMENGYRGESLWSGVLWRTCERADLGFVWCDLLGGMSLDVVGVSDLICVWWSFDVCVCIVAGEQGMKDGARALKVGVDMLEVGEKHGADDESCGGFGVRGGNLGLSDGGAGLGE